MTRKKKKPLSVEMFRQVGSQDGSLGTTNLKSSSRVEVTDEPLETMDGTSKKSTLRFPIQVLSVSLSLHNESSCESVISVSIILINLIVPWLK